MGASTMDYHITKIIKRQLWSRVFSLTCIVLNFSQDLHLVHGYLFDFTLAGLFSFHCKHSLHSCSPKRKRNIWSCLFFTNYFSFEPPPFLHLLLLALLLFHVWVGGIILVQASILLSHILTKFFLLLMTSSNILVYWVSTLASYSFSMWWMSLLAR